MHTDYLDNPVKRGDVIIYPTASGSSSAGMNVAIVDLVDPIVTAHARKWDGSIREVTTLKSYIVAAKKDPTSYSIPNKRVRLPDPQDPNDWRYQYVPDESKAYVVRAFKLDNDWSGNVSGRSTILKNVDRITVVPRNQWGPAFAERVADALRQLQQNGITF